MPETLIAVFVVRRGEFQDRCNMNETQETRDATRPEAMGAGEPPPSHALVPARPAGLPVPHDAVRRLPSRRWWLRIAVLLVILAGGAGGGYYYWWQYLRAALPSGIVYGNGRLEADEIDIDTKYAGRIAEMLADEGDMVKAGQVVARMDTRDLEASLKKSEAQVNQAQRAPSTRRTLTLRSRKPRSCWRSRNSTAPALLVQKGFQTKEVLDQRQQQLDGANAALNAANMRVIEFEHALDAATHDVELYGVQIADNTLVAPRDGRIEYRIANIGEVLPAGGKVFAMLDTSYVYMDIYLPTQEAGKVRFGADARIVLDAYPKSRFRPRSCSSPRRPSSRPRSWKPRPSVTS